MTRKRIVLLTAVLAILVAGAWLASSILHDGLSAEATPTRLEIAIARNVRRLAMPANAHTMANPIPATPESVREGMLHFADHCATCHANDGSGDTLYGRGLYPKPPDMRQAATQDLSDGEIFCIIENGVRFTGMPAFATHREQDASWKLVRFIRHLPQLTREERAEMERNNPKSAGDRDEKQEEQDFLRKGDSGAKSGVKAHHH
jgi:mono/diheme cytochrome c family protein